MAEGILSDEEKIFVVQCLACFDSPATVAAAVKAEYGKVITRQAVHAYDPTKAAGAKLSDKFKAIFEETRAAYLENTATIGISSRAVRLRRIERLLDRAESQGNTALAAQLLAQAAKEVGNVFTNKAELTGGGGGPVQVERVERVIVRPPSRPANSDG